MTDLQLCDFSSPSDWPSNWQELRKIDNLLRCTICGDFFNNTTQVPSCSHNYCGLCIRRHLSYQSKCPSCNVIVNEKQLENNRIIDEIVKTFIPLRKRLLELVNPTADKVSKSVKKKRGSSSAVVENTLDLTPCSSKWPQKRHRNFSKSSPSSLENTSFKEISDEDEISIIDDLSPVQTSSQKKHQAILNTTGTSVGCPVCDKKVSPNMINTHLDACLKSIDKPESASTQSMVKSPIGANALIPQVKKRKLLNKLVYTLLSDKQLKQKMKELGLSLKGNRQELIKRHREFINYYNSECSKPKPKSVKEIVRLVEDGERMKKKKNSNEKLMFDRGKTQEDIDKAKENYISQNQDQFSQLIKNIKKRKNKSDENEAIEDDDIASVNPFDKTLKPVNDDSDSSIDFYTPRRKQKTPKRRNECTLRVTRSRSKKKRAKIILDRESEPSSPSIINNISNEETDEIDNLSGDSESMFPDNQPSTSCFPNHGQETPTLSNESDELFES